MSTKTRNVDTRVSDSLDGDLSLEDLRVPGLTILAHPDAHRVGERVTLPELTSGREVHLARFEPGFVPVGADLTGCRPLGDSHVSRQPIRLAPGAEARSVVLDASSTPMAVEADGRVVDTRRTFSDADIARGVVLLLGHRVALLLHTLPPLPPEPMPRFGLVGESSAIVRVCRQIHQAAALAVPVLLTGETGTGKDLVARALHGSSPRRDRPFVTVNMGAIPPSLASSELFGAARGAFTGAERKKIGFFQKAHPGTLFLDEIGETPPEVQGLLLRALESGEIQPVGGVECRRVDVRVIAATDADLDSAVAAGRFRGPLYHRLSGYQIALAPLTERRDDIGRLLFHFLGLDLNDANRRPWPPARVVARLAGYDWPGNVRELRNVARRLSLERPSGSKPLLALVEELIGQKPEPALAGPSSTTAPGPSRSERPEPSRFRKPSEVSESELLEALETCRWRLQPTAAALGISRTALYRLIEGSSCIRKAAEIDRREIEKALASTSHDPEAAALSLRVSLQGLKMRMTQLGLDGPG